MFYIFISFIIGAFTVIQGGLNHRIGKVWGLPFTLLINSALVLIFSLIFFGLCLIQPSLLPGQNLSHQSWSQFKWWYLVPGLCGFSIVLGIPLSLPKLGASGVFLALVVGQMSFSLLWDFFVEHQEFDFKRMTGVFLALLGFVISNWNRE